MIQGTLAAKQRADEAFGELQEALAESPQEALPAFLGGLARLEAEARLRLTLPRLGSFSAAPEDRLLNVQEAAQRLSISASKLYKTADKFPFTIREGRALRFSSHGIDRWISKRTR